MWQGPATRMASEPTTATNGFLGQCECRPRTGKPHQYILATQETYARYKRR